MNEATELELKRASQIKEAAEADPDLNTDMILDLEFLHHAIVAKENIALAVQRLKRMQAFKKQYGIQLDGDMEQAKRDIAVFFAEHSGLHLALGALPDGSHVLCQDHSKFYASMLNTPEAYAIRFRGLFYFLHAVQHNITAMRAGCHAITDMKEATWRNFNFKYMRQCAQLVYQKRIHSVPDN